MKSRHCTQSFVLFEKENKIEETSRRMSRRIKSNRKPLREDCRTTSLGVRSIWQLFRDQWRRHDISSYSGRLHFKIRPELNHKEGLLNYSPISLQAKSGQTPDILQSSGRREGCKELRQVIWGGEAGSRHLPVHARHYPPVHTANFTVCLHVHHSEFTVCWLLCHSYFRRLPKTFS